MFGKNRDLKKNSGFESSPKSGSMSRRKFFARAGLATFFLSLGGFMTSIVAFILPKLNYEPKQTVSIGRPEDYQPGDMRLLESEQIYVFKSEKGFQAVSAICTHLGCSYKPFTAPAGSYEVVHALCPCHGSVFDRAGRVIGGPAPKPLPFYFISYSADGRMIADKGLNNPTDKLSRAADKGIAHNLYFDPDSGEMVAGDIPTGEDCKPCTG